MLVQDDPSDPDVISGVKKGDARSSLVFNLLLNQVVRHFDSQKDVFNSSLQICAYAEKIYIITRDVATLKKAFSGLEKEALQVGLQFNDEKTKYMLRTKLKTTQLVLLLAIRVSKL